MTPLATVLIPTHDHGPLLAHAVATALAQTVREIEVLVIGDGVPEATRRIMSDVISRDPRMRFFDHPKGPRHGEAYRHAALQSARGAFVAYLSDDDLWLPEHLEEMAELLRDADFAHTLPVFVDAAGHAESWTIDLARSFYRRLLQSGHNRFPLSCVAHRREAYQRLPQGWHAAPAGIPTDLHMWQQFLSDPACTFRSGFRATAIHFPSPQRRGWTEERRLDELQRWRAKLDNAEGQMRLHRDLLSHATAERAALEERVHAAAAEQQAHAENQRRCEELESTIDGFQQSATCKLRHRLHKHPLLERPLRWVARALTRSAIPEATAPTHPSQRASD